MARILIVDDQPDIRSMIRLRLELSGYAADEADNGQIGVTMALQGKYDLVLLDMHMPVMDGYEAISTLRAAGYTGVVVAVTASALPADRNRALGEGCDAVILKPVDENFEGFIQEFLEGNR